MSSCKKKEEEDIKNTFLNSNLSPKKKEKKN